MKGFSENLKVHHKNKREEGNRKKKESMRAKLETIRLRTPPRHEGVVETLWLPPRN